MMVSVEVKLGWAVAVSVAEGSGLVVQAGSMTGVGIGWMNVSIPHPIDVSVTTNIAIIVFRKLLQRMIEIPNNAQTIEREPGGNDLDDIGFLLNDRCQPAGGNDLHAGTKFLAETLDHALDHANITE